MTVEILKSLTNAELLNYLAAISTALNTETIYSPEYVRSVRELVKVTKEIEYRAIK